MKHILFDLDGTLVDAARRHVCYTAALGQVMAEQFGESSNEWTEAYQLILADWDNYYADLDLAGENAIADLREGELRVTRALFRLTHKSEPDSANLSALAQDLPYLASCHYDAFYEDCKPVIQQLHANGFMLGIASRTTSQHTRGILEGAGIANYFNGAILAPDVTGHFLKSRDFFLSSHLAPEDCVVVDDEEGGIRGAKEAGMRTVQILRNDRPPSRHADIVIRGGLGGLLGYLGL